MSLHSQAAYAFLEASTPLTVTSSTKKILICIKILQHEKSQSKIWVDEFDTISSQHFSLTKICDVLNEELSRRFREAVRIKNELKKIKRLPIAKYDYEKNASYE